MKEIIKKVLPLPIKKLIGKFLKLIIYTEYDSSSYWKSRSVYDDQSAVLWKNEEYNNLYRKKQKEILKPYIENLSQSSKVLDIGCGIGVVSLMLNSINNKVMIDAVDFNEMIEVAKKKNPANSNINYISSSAEEYIDANKKYDVIISSGCFSAIRDVKKMKLAINNSINMCGEDGTILMIDPFHKWNYLARVKFNTNDVQKYMHTFGFKLIKKSGVIFWPYRDKLANSTIKGNELINRFEKGERLLSIFGKHFWADYKILIFKKIDD